MSGRFLNSRRILSSSLLFFLLLVVPSANDPSRCLSKYETEIKCPQYWQVASPGETVTFDLTVVNPTRYYDSFLMYFEDSSLPENWKASFYAGNRRVRGISVDPMKSVSLVLQVNIPDDASHRDFQFTVVAEGEYSIATRTLMVTVETEPPAPYEIELYSPIDWQVTYPGNNLTFSLNVKNCAPYSENYLVYVDNPSLPENWTGRFYVDGKRVKSFGALPGEAVDLVLEVDVPENAAPGDYRFRVQIDGDYASTSHGITVTVESHPPIQREISLLCPYPSQSILTGQSTQYLIKVTNEGEQTETVFLNVNKTSETMTWETSFSESQLTLAPGESTWIKLDVEPPSIVEEGSYTVNVTCSTEDGELETTLQTTTKILGNYLLEITGVQPINPQISSGEKIDVIVTVRNMGQSPLTTIKLNVNATGISNILVTPLDILALEPMASVDFYVRITPNTGLTPGDYIIEVQAGFWITICITIIATSLAVITIQKLVSRWGIGIKIRK